jgi:hypothetical protein
VFIVDDTRARIKKNACHVKRVSIRLVSFINEAQFDYRRLETFILLTNILSFSRIIRLTKVLVVLFIRSLVLIFTLLVIEISVEKVNRSIDIFHLIHAFDFSLQLFYSIE